MALSYLGSGGSLIVSSLAQLATFAILARALGADEFALYVTLSAFTAVAAQICGLGVQETLVRRIAREPSDYPRLMGHAFVLTFGTAALLLVGGIAVLPFVVPLPALTIGLMLASNVLVTRFISLANAAYIAQEKFAVANLFEVGFGLIRAVAAALACLAFGVVTVADWAVWFFAAHAIGALAALWLILRLGRPRLALLREEIAIGALFSTQFIFKAIRQNTDIVVLGLFTSAEIVSSYGVARRVLDSSYLSIEALNRLIYPGSAVLLVHGFHSALGRVLRVMGAGIGIAIAAALTVYTLAPLMPVLFGPEYTSMVGFTQVLSFVVVPIAVSSIALEAFGAAGRQDVRALIYNGANITAAIVVAAAAWLAGVEGVFAATYALETLVAITACLVLWRFVEADRARIPSAVPAE